MVFGWNNTFTYSVCMHAGYITRWKAKTNMDCNDNTQAIK